MTEPLVTSILLALGVYLGLGALFAVPFVAFGVGRIDPVAREGTWGFRLAVLPAAIALWPLLAWRWARPAPPPVETNPHRRAARGGPGDPRVTGEGR